MAAKLKDGLFLGDFEAAQDLEFIVANKITRIINCAGREIANAWERTGIRYLTYYWPENGHCIIFDESNSVLDEIYSFIEEALEAGDSVLVHSTDGVSRASFCSAVYFMLKFRWALSKTVAYLQSKRPDLMPKPGFMRQLQALDASLQRVTKASGKGPSDPALRRYTEWDPTALGPATDPTGEDEALLTNTYVNSQPVPEDVIIAAQSSVPLPRAAPAPLSHSQGNVHFAQQVATIAGATGPVRPGSAPVAGRRGVGPATGAGGGITWIDDPRRSGTTHVDVPVSPTTKRPTMERPPGSSYSSLAVGAGWSDHSSSTIAVSVSTPNGGMSTSKVLPTANGTVSAAAAHVPHYPTASSPSKLKSALRGGSRWMQQQGYAPAPAPPPAAAPAPASRARAAAQEGKDDASGKMSERESKLADAEDARKMKADADARRASAASLSARSHSSSSLTEDTNTTAGVRGSQRIIVDIGGRPIVPAVSRGTVGGTISGTTAPAAMSATLAGLSTSYVGSSSTTGSMRPPSPSSAANSMRQSYDFPSGASGTAGMRPGTAPAPSSVAVTAAQLQRSAGMGTAVSAATAAAYGSGMSATMTSSSAAAVAAAAQARTTVGMATIRGSTGLSGGGPVKATAAVMPMTATRAAAPATSGAPAAAMASLNAGNLSRTLATGGGGGSYPSALEADASAGTSMPRVAGASGVPARTASSRVRGYSPGPGKARERAAAAASRLAAPPASAAPAPATASTLLSASYGAGQGGSYAATGGGYGVRTSAAAPTYGGAATTSSYPSAVMQQQTGAVALASSSMQQTMAASTVSAAAASRGRAGGPVAGTRPTSATLAPLASSSSSSLSGAQGGFDGSFVRSGGLAPVSAAKATAPPAYGFGSPAPAPASAGVRSASVGARTGTPTRPVSAQPARGSSPGPSSSGGAVMNLGGSMRVAAGSQMMAGLASSAFLTGSHLGGTSLSASYGGASPSYGPISYAPASSAATSAPMKGFMSYGGGAGGAPQGRTSVGGGGGGSSARAASPSTRPSSAGKRS